MKQVNCSVLYKFVFFLYGVHISQPFSDNYTPSKMSVLRTNARHMFSLLPQNLMVFINTANVREPN